MKRFIRILALILSIFVIIAAVGSCDLFGKKEPIPDIVLEDLCGSWKRELSNGDEIYNFVDNMKYNRSKLGDIEKGTFTISGCELTVTSSETKKPVVHIVRFSEDKNTMIWGDGPVTAEYKRQ